MTLGIRQVELRVAQIDADKQRLDRARQERDQRITHHVVRTLAELRHAATATDHQGADRSATAE